MAQPPLDKIIQALEHDKPSVRTQGINALVKTTETTPQTIIDTLDEMKDMDSDAEVRKLAATRLQQYRQYIQKKQAQPTPAFITDTPPPSAPSKAASPPHPAPISVSKDTFVLNPKNIPFLLGERPQPEIKSIWGEMMTFFIAFLLGLLILVFAGMEAKPYFEWRLAPISGTLTGARVVQEQVQWEAAFEYTDDSGSLQRGTTTFEDMNAFFNLPIGETVKIKTVNGTPQMVLPAKLTFFGGGGIVMGTLMALGFPISMFALLGRRDRHQALVEKGIVIDGIITEAKLELDQTRAAGGAGGGCIGFLIAYVYTTHMNPKYILTVNYQFMSPETGKPVPGVEKEQRNDLNGKRAPMMNTPVKILFLNDKNHIML